MDTTQIQRLREQTSAGVMACKRALEESGGDYEAAVRILEAQAQTQAAKLADRDTSAVRVGVYVHGEGARGAIVRVGCNTDFVARGDQVEQFCRQLAMQAVAFEPADVEQLLATEWIGGTGESTDEMRAQLAMRVGENIQVLDFAVL